MLHRRDGKIPAEDPLVPRAWRSDEEGPNEDAVSFGIFLASLDGGEESGTEYDMTPWWALCQNLRSPEGSSPGTCHTPLSILSLLKELLADPSVNITHADLS